MFEKLEMRRLLAGVTAVVSGSTYNISGGSKAATIAVVENNGTVTVTDENTGNQFSASGITKINITGGPGGNNIFFTGDSVGANINAGSAKDSVTVDDEGTASSTVNGGSGDDSLIIIHGNNTQVDGGSGNNSIYLNTAVNGGSANVVAGSGNDVVTIYDGNNNVNGQSGNDTFITFGGNNTLVGQAGNDVLVNAGGNDMFTQ